MRRFNNLMVAGIVFAAGLWQSVAVANAYNVDVKDSKVTWVGKKISGQHDGFLKLKSGQFDMEKQTGKFVIDMNSIVNSDLEGEWNTKLVDHLKSDDFFNVKKYPEASFALKTLKKKSGDSYTFEGDLTVKNITKPVSFLATVKEGKGSVSIKAKFEIDRTNWDIRYNSGKFFDVKKLGDKMINDNIEIGLDLKASAKPKAS